MKSTNRIVLLTLTIVMLVIASGLIIDKNKATMASSSPSTEINLQVDDSQEVVVKLYYDSREQLNSVSGELDIWEVHPLPGIGPGSGYVLAPMYPSQQDWLAAEGFRIEVDQEHTALLKAPASALDPRYYYFDDFVPNSNGLYMVDFLQNTNTAYPALTELIDIGDAWQAGNNGHHRDMWVLRITNEDPAFGDIANKPAFFMFANIHAREVTTPEMAIRYIKYLLGGYRDLGGYDVDPDVTWLVNHHVVYVLISQNPDGRVINELEINNYRRKNMDPFGCSSPDYLGVDLNRNHSFLWGCCGGSSGSGCSETYRGQAAGSEPETAAFQDYFATVFLDQNGPNGNNEIPPAAPDNTTGIFISLHSYADEILWPWGFSTYGNSPNNAQLTTVGRKLAFFTDGAMTPSDNIGYDVDGATDDWVYGKFGIAAYTFEIGSGWEGCGDFFPAYGCQDGIDGMPRDFWSEMRKSFVYANKIARSPYLTSYGPDAINVIPNPADVSLGVPFDLNATIIDQRYGGDPLKPIIAAEYFIDAEGADGTGIAMLPGDGNWGQTTEAVTAVVDTNGLSQGKHYILVHGKNNEGKWGAFTAAFFTVTVPSAPLAGFTSNSPVLLGQQMNFINQTVGSEPITYLWDFGDGSGTSTLVDPTYTYLNIGAYTVTLTATNELGMDVFSQGVEVLPPVIDSISITQITPDPIYPGDEVSFSMDLIPDNAGKPYTFTITFGDGEEQSGTSSDDPMEFTHTYAQAGSFQVQVQVQNDSMLIPVFGSTEVIVNPVVVPLFRTFLAITIK